MKLPALALLSAALLCAAPALAQTAPHPTPNPAMRQAFEQMRTRMESVRRTERAQMLGALKPANKTLLATIAGQLATSVSPDYGAAAKRLDSALSATESQAVLRAAQNARTQERSIMESMRSQFSPPPNAPRFGMNGPGGSRPGGPHHRTPDAGRMLLGLMGGGPMRMGPPGMRGGFSHR